MPGSALAESGIVIVGGGQAGCQVAASLREAGDTRPVTILGDEPHLPYQRPPLSKAFLDGQVADSGLALRSASYFDQAGITLASGRRAIAIDRAAKIVVTDDHGRLPYDHLVLATGARNRALDIPGIDLSGVLQLRSLNDARIVRDALTDISSLVIVGAGFIGLELAALARARGLRVDVVEIADRPMARALSEPMAGFYRDAHANEGVIFHFGHHVTRIVGADGRVTGVETSGGVFLPAQAVLIGVGVVANDDIAQAAGLATANGILTDERLLTNDPAISAIGDCAAYPQPFADGSIMRVESVQNAVDQARCVAARLCGKPSAYSAVPWFWSDQGRRKLQIAGIAAGHDHTVIRGDIKSESFSVFCFRQGHLAAVESVNRPADHMIARRLIGQRINVTPEMAADLAVDLKSLAAGGRVAA